MSHPCIRGSVSRGARRRTESNPLPGTHQVRKRRHEKHWADGSDRLAYDLEWYQISGPSWLPDRHFDIVAKVDRPTPDDEMRAMTQTLLANRFGLKAHQEDKELSGMAITVGKDGPQLKVSEDSGESTFGPIPKTMTIKMTHRSMRMLARILTEVMGNPVVDLTGLKAAFDFALDGSSRSTGISGARRVTA